MDAKRFFSAGLPHVVAGNLKKFATLQGRIAFSVGDEGSWTLRLGDIENPIVDGMDMQAELKMWFSSAAFGGFLDGKINILQALENGEFRFAGDTVLMEKLGYLLSPGGSPLAMRMGGGL